MNTATTTTPPPTEEQWAIVELMGHVKYGGRISKDTEFGTGLIRIDVPAADGTEITQLINPSSLYRMTFCTKELATAAAKAGNANPYSDWEVGHILKLAGGEFTPPGSFFGDDDDEDDDPADRELDPL